MVDPYLIKELHDVRDNLANGWERLDFLLSDENDEIAIPSELASPLRDLKAIMGCAETSAVDILKAITQLTT